MRIVQINSTYATGSNGRLAMQIADYVRNSGNECLFFYANGKTDAYGTCKISGKTDRLIHAIMSRLTGLQGYYSLISTFKLIKKIRIFQPDVIHLHNLHSNYINLHILLNYIAENNIGLVVTLHDCWFFTGKCVHPIYANCSKFHNTCKKCPQIKSDKVNPTFWFDMTTKCQTDKRKWFSKIEKKCIVGVSRWITEEAQKSSVFRNSKCETIYNWVDSKDFCYRRNLDVEKKYSIDRKKNIVLFVSSSLSLNKGYSEMCLLSQRLSTSYQIVFVGSCGALELPANIIHVPKTQSVEELSYLYSAANVCVNLTNGETFGLVTAESLFCGTPAIVYNNTASPELIGEGCGYIINNKGDIDTIVKKIDTICKNGKDFYIAKCRDFATKKFSKQNSLEKYLYTYKSLV